MVEYTPKNPAFKKKINLVERADIVNAQIHNDSIKQLIENDVALKEIFDKALGMTEDEKLKFAEGIKSDNLVGAVNEVFQIGNEKKEKFVENLVARGVPVSTDETWESLLNKVLSMSDVSKDTIIAAAILEGYTAHNAAGAKITGSLADKTGTADYSATASLDTTDKRLKLKVPATGKYNASNYLYAAYNTVASLIGLTAGKLVKGNTILGIIGDNNNMDTSGADAAAGDILSGKKAAVKGGMVTGSLADKTGTADYSATASLDTTDKRLKLKVPATGKYNTNNYLYAAYNTIANLIGLTAGKLVKGNTILGIAGDSNNMDTAGADAAAGDILSGKKAAVKGSLIIGTMTNRGAWSKDTTDSGNVAIPVGYHNGEGYISGAGAYNKGVSDADARTNVDSANYKSGYSAGVSDADGRTNINSANYKSGYDAGNSAGWNSGHTTGYSEGYSAGHADASAATKRWMLLGTGTSYNIKNLYPDLYAGLTASNFIVVLDGPMSAAGEENEHITSVGVSIPKPTINYNNSTGVLTITKSGELYWEDTANWGEHHTIPIDVPIKVYLLC